MKKNILLSLLILFSIHAMAQEKGSHFSISAGVGPSGFNYKMPGVDFADPKCDIKVGGQVGLGYSYFFTKHIGISTGIGLSHYRTYAKLMGAYNYGNSMGNNFMYDKYFVLGNYTDNDFDGNVKDYELRVLTQNWIEYQSGKFIEIPLTLNLQKKFGEKEIFGVYAAAGLKFQIPIGANYSVEDGNNKDNTKLNVYGYYEEKNLPLGHYASPDLSQHGFGVIHNPSAILTNATGGMNLKFNLSLVGEAGFLISLSRRVDISLGAFVDYGLINFNKNKEAKKMFTGPETDYVAGAENYNVGNGIAYNSIVKTEYVGKMNTISYGGKVGIRIKLGKLSEKPVQEIKPIGRDTVIIINKQPLDSIVQVIVDALKDSIKAIVPKVIERPVQTIPAETQIVTNGYPEQEIDILLEPIYFDLNMSVLKPESIRNLSHKVNILNRFPDIKLVIIGNTCDLGDDFRNTKLGFDRAKAVKTYLINAGIAAERLEITTLSRFAPELPNTNEENRLHNRRCDFRLLTLGNAHIKYSSANTLNSNTAVENVGNTQNATFDSNSSYYTYQKGKFYVIAGSFVNEKDALLHIKQQKLDRYNAKLIIHPESSRIRVCIGVYDNENDASAFAAQINKTYWVLE